jgi:hypothetical protein
MDGEMDLFELACEQLEKEGKNPESNFVDMLDRAVKIRKWLDTHKRETAAAIMSGAKYYKYGNAIKVYDRA